MFVARDQLYLTSLFGNNRNISQAVCVGVVGYSTMQYASSCGEMGGRSFRSLRAPCKEQDKEQEPPGQQCSCSQGQEAGGVQQGGQERAGEGDCQEAKEGEIAGDSFTAPGQGGRQEAGAGEQANLAVGKERKRSKNVRIRKG